MKPTHFKCDNCDKIKSIEQSNVVKCEYTCFDNESVKKFSCYHYHIQICNECMKQSKEEK